MVRQRGGRGMELALLYLIHFLIEFGIHRIPIITLVTGAFQIILFLGIGPPIMIAQEYSDVTLSWYKVAVKGQYGRLFFGQMEHSSDFHLYHNIMSLVWKGYFIERAVGFKKFLSIMAVFITLVGLGTISLNFACSWVFFNGDYIYTEALGFQGVLFALKVLMAQFDPAGGLQHGQLLQAGSWLELAISSLFNRYQSLMGNLVGIAIGYEYVYGPGIIKGIVVTVEGIITLVLEMTGFAEDIEQAADNWNERDDGQANPNAGRGMGMFGMGMGGMGMGMGGGLFGGRRRAYRRY